MKIYLLCWGVVFVFLSVSYVWGRSFFSLIKSETDISSGILFGFVILLTTYHILYTPVFLLRGSYKTVSLIWFAIATLVTVYLLLRMIRAKVVFLTIPNRKTIISLILVSGFFMYLCFFISLHPPAYGSDTNAYINAMNAMYYNSAIWIKEGSLDIQHGMSSLLGLMTVPSLILKIRPFYTGLFTMRILLVLLTGMAVYKIGKIALTKDSRSISVEALWMSMIVSVIIMFWNSDYQAHFFFRRSNEAKAYCQFILYPLAFSVFLQMCMKVNTINRNKLWIQQFIIGLSAVAISMSSLTGYPFLLFMGMLSVLTYDRFKKPFQTTLLSLLCATPNILYTVFYLLQKNSYLIL